jgi:hypothetical protein
MSNKHYGKSFEQSEGMLSMVKMAMENGSLPVRAKPVEDLSPSKSLAANIAKLAAALRVRGQEERAAALEDKFLTYKQVQTEMSYNEMREKAHPDGAGKISVEYDTDENVFETLDQVQQRMLEMFTKPVKLNSESSEDEELDEAIVEVSRYAKRARAAAAGSNIKYFDLIEQAHKDDEPGVEGVVGDARVDNAIEKQKRTMEAVLHQPTGKIAGIVAQLMKNADSEEYTKFVTETVIKFVTETVIRVKKDIDPIVQQIGGEIEALKAQAGPNMGWANNLGGNVPGFSFEELKAAVARMIDEKTMVEANGIAATGANVYRKTYGEAAGSIVAKLNSVSRIITAGWENLQQWKPAKSVVKEVASDRSSDAARSQPDLNTFKAKAKGRQVKLYEGGAYKFYWVSAKDSNGYYWWSEDGKPGGFVKGLNENNMPSDPEAKKK